MRIAMEHMKRESESQRRLIRYLERQAQLVPALTEHLNFMKQEAQQRLSYEQLVQLTIADRDDRVQAITGAMEQVVDRCIKGLSDSMIEQQIAMRLRIAGFPTEPSQTPPASIEAFRTALADVLDNHYRAYQQTFQPLLEGFNTSTGKLHEFLLTLTQRASHEQVRPDVLFIQNEQHVLVPLRQIGCRQVPDWPKIVELSASREGSTTREEPADEASRAASPSPQPPSPRAASSSRSPAAAEPAGGTEEPTVQTDSAPAPTAQDTQSQASKARSTSVPGVRRDREVSVSVSNAEGATEESELPLPDAKTARTETETCEASDSE